MSGIAITKTILAQLNNNENITKIIGDKIFPIVADDGTTFPFILLKKNGMTTIYTKMGAVNDVINFTIEVVDNKYSRAVQIAEEIRKTIERQKYDEIINCEIQNTTEEYVADTYIISQLYKIQIINE